MTFDTLLSVATISFLGMVSPGPDFFLVVKNSLSYPRKFAMITCLGIIMAVFTHMSYCVGGIAILIKTIPWLYSILRYMGAAYLIWIGGKAIFAKVGGASYIAEDSKKRTISYKQTFMQGYLCNLLNPKATLFFFAVFTQVLSINSTIVDKLSVAAIIWLEAAIWWPLVVIIFQSEIVRRRYFKIQFIVDKLLGLILMTLGCKVALGI